MVIYNNQLEAATTVLNFCFQTAKYRMQLIMREFTVTSPPLSYGLLISLGSSALSELLCFTPRIAELHNSLPSTTIVSSSPLKAVPALRELHYCTLASQDLDC